MIDMKFTNLDLKHFELAKKISKYSSHYKATIGSIIVYNKTVISVGYNSNYRSHPLQKHYNKFRDFDDTNIPIGHLIHAELDALIKFRNVFFPDLPANNLSIYNARILRNGELGNSRPCKGCIQALKDFNIHNIYYTTLDGYCYEQI